MRKILHVDLNNCYASIECLHQPHLWGKAMSVGGDVEARHGIILSSTYEAKAYGIKVGETLGDAQAKCPGLIILPPNYPLYLRFSRLVRNILEQYSDQVEPFGLDESWVDVTGERSATLVGNEIRNRIKRELGLTVSVGVSFNKIFAKLGSDYKKPDATTVFTQDNYKEKIWPLPVSDLLGVGRATTRKLALRSVRTIGQLATTDLVILKSWLGKWGEYLHAFANGLDSSPVARKTDDEIIKSIGNSITAPRDLLNEQDVKLVFYNLAESVASRLRDNGFKGKVVQISLRDNDLYSFERQLTLKRPTDVSNILVNAAMELLNRHYSWHKPLRSIGIKAAQLCPTDQPQQYTLFEDPVKEMKQQSLEKAIDLIRNKYGHYSITRALCKEDTLLGHMNIKGDNIIHPVGYFG